jgi:hypothetical protein
MARSYRRECGIEKIRLSLHGEGQFNVLMLPPLRQRQGLELRCEVVGQEEPL